MAKAVLELDIPTIKALFAELKEKRITMTWDEFAKKAKVDRVYLSRVINGHEPLTYGVVAKIKAAFPATTENVANATPPVGSLQTNTAPVLDGKDQTNWTLVNGIGPSLNDLRGKIEAIDKTVTANQQTLARLSAVLDSMGKTTVYKERDNGPGGKKRR